MGTFGVGIISQLNNLNSLSVFIGTVGIPLGITKIISELESENKWEDIRKIFLQLLLLLLLFSASIFVPIYLFSGRISQEILGSTEYSHFVSISLLGIPFLLCISIFDSFLRGLKKFKDYVKISIWLSLISVIITAVCIIYFNLYGAVYSILISSVVSFLFYLVFLIKKKVISLRDLYLIRLPISPYFRVIFAIGLASLFVGLIEQFTTLVVRSIIIKEFGIDTNGIYQSVYAISNNYFNILYMSIGIYLLPMLSGMKDRIAVNTEINKILKLTIVSLVPLTSITFVFREWIIVLLYNNAFLPGESLMMLNLTGDFFKALSWILGAWMIPAGKVKIWLILAILNPILNFTIFFIGINFTSLGIKSIVLSYAVASIVHFILVLHYSKKIQEFIFMAKNLKNIVFAGLLIFVVFLIDFESNYLAMIILPILLFFWFKFSITRSDLQQLIQIFKSKIKTN